jgi:anti-sigma-K factor RskA
MNKEQFLNTGLLEQYALGLTSEEENKFVEQHLQAYPELQGDVREIRHAIEQYALQNAIPPHPRVKSQIMSKIDESASPIASRSTSINRWLSAAAFLSFAAVLALLFMYTQKQAQNQQLKREFAELQMACNEKTDQIVADQEMMLFIKDRHTQKVSLDPLVHIRTFSGRCVLES